MQYPSPVTFTVEHQGRWLNLFSLYVTDKLIWLSKHYAAWRGIREMPGIHSLPFGFLVKITSNYPEQEAYATMMARKMGIPVPRILLYGESEDGLRGSILMTRIPGNCLATVMESYSTEELAVVLKEVGECLKKIRSFPSPYGEAVCGPLGGNIHNRYVPMHNLERQRNSDEFYAKLYTYADLSKGKDLMERAQMLQGKSQRIVLGHSDLTPYNIMVKDGHLTGIIDWEYGGWYPEYWDFVLPDIVRSGHHVWRIPGGEDYGIEKDAWAALVRLLYILIANY